MVFVLGTARSVPCRMRISISEHIFKVPGREKDPRGSGKFKTVQSRKHVNWDREKLSLIIRTTVCPRPPIDVYLGTCTVAGTKMAAPLPPKENAIFKRVVVSLPYRAV